MYGAIIGDIAGSTLEFDESKVYDIPLFLPGSDITDDTIMTIAVAKALLQWQEKGGDLAAHMVEQMQSLGRAYPCPMGAYGTKFKQWLRSSHPKPYYSCGNGSAMRVSPCALMAKSLEEALELAKISAQVTHDHPEGIKGAQATAAAVYLARTGHSIEEIRDYIRENFYPLDRALDEIRPDYGFEPTCQESVPQSIQAFLESESFEDAIRKVLSLGGDADTMGAITGSIAWAYYGARGMTETMIQLKSEAESYLPEAFLKTIRAMEQLCE